MSAAAAATVPQNLLVCFIQRTSESFEKIEPVMREQCHKLRCSQWSLHLCPHFNQRQTSSDVHLNDEYVPLMLNY